MSTPPILNFSIDIREHETTFPYTEMIPSPLELLQIHSCSTPKKINKDNVKMYLTLKHSYDYLKVSQIQNEFMTEVIVSPKIQTKI